MTATVTTAVSQKPIDSPSLSAGDVVEIIAGTYCHQSGTVDRLTAKMVYVKLEGGVKRIYQSSCRRRKQGSENGSTTLLSPVKADLEEKLPDTTASSSSFHSCQAADVSITSSSFHSAMSSRATPVQIIGGKYCGQSGATLVPHRKPLKHMIAVQWKDENGVLVERRLKQSSVRVVNDEEETLKQEVEDDMLAVSDIPTKHSRQGVIDKEQELEEHSSAALWRLAAANNDYSNEVFDLDPQLMVACIRVVSSRQPRQQLARTFFEHWLGERCLVLHMPLTRTDLIDTVLPEQLKPDGGSNVYELVGCKVEADKEYVVPYGRMMRACVTYAQASSLNIREEFEKLADFDALPSATKVAARLDLLQSPAGKLRAKNQNGMFFIKASHCMVLDEDHGSDGCGFIDETFLQNLLGNTVDARRSIALQVRMIIPALGIFKGVLMRKRRRMDTQDETYCPIQLVPSMRKVPASRHPDALVNEAVLIVTQTGFHPHPRNHMIGRLLNPQHENPPPASFDKDIKPLSPMIIRQMKLEGIPESVVDEYARESKVRRRLHHAWLVGVADPTHSIPPGHVYCPGLSKSSNSVSTHLWITRCPCLQPGDARCLPTVCTKRPDGMSLADWEWLESLPFGAIIFADSYDSMPLPETIAGGDLDGDLYFCCWDDMIVAKGCTDDVSRMPVQPPNKIIKETVTVVKAEEKEGEEPMQLEEENGEHDSSSSAPTPAPTPTLSTPSTDWFTSVQKFMSTSPARVQGIDELIGKLYDLATKEEATDEERDLFATAYKEALDLGKHGGTITSLPKELCCKYNIPERLHHFFVEERLLV